MDLAAAKIAWLVSPMGYGSELAYWGPVLAGFVSRTRACRVYWDRSIPPPAMPGIDFAPLLGFFEVSYASPDIVEKRRPLRVPSPAVLRDILRFDPDLIVIAEFFPVSFLGAFAAHLGRRRKLLQLIENDPGPLEHAPLGLRRRIRRFFCRCPDLILTNNAAGTRYLTDKLSVPADKIVTAVYQTSALPHQPEHPPEMAGKPDRAKIRFLFVGQLIERKGVDRLLKAVASLDTNLRQRCHVTIIGDGDARESLHELMHALGIAEQVTMLGHVPYAELPAHYAGADVFVLPTLFDYRACVSFEALSQGLALLMSNRNGAVAEVVDEGENGFSFDPDNVPELAERLAWFIAGPGHLARFRRRSLQLAVNFTVENAIDNLAQACQRCLDGRQQQAGPI